MTDDVGEAPFIFEIKAVEESAVDVAEVELEVEFEVGDIVAKVDLDRSKVVLSFASLVVLSVSDGLLDEVLATVESMVGEVVGPSCLLIIARRSATAKLIQKHSNRTNRTFDRIV